MNDEVRGKVLVMRMDNEANDALIEPFSSVWKKMPFSDWDCASGAQWERVRTVLFELVNTLRNLPDQATLTYLPNKASEWFRDLFQALNSNDCGTSVSFLTVAKLMQESSLKRISFLRQKLGVDSSQVGLFLRAAAEEGEPEALAHFLTTLTFTEKPVSARLALVQHVLDRRLKVVAGSGEGIRIGENPGHVAFHFVTPSSEKNLDVERFESLVGKQLALAGVADPDRIERRLRWAAPWLDQVIDVLKRRVEATLLGWGGVSFPPMLLVGPPGAGKSWFAQKIGEALGLPTLVISAAGSMDNMALKGTARGWNSARPGLPIEFIAQHQVANPLIVVDEIDKVSEAQRNGNMLDTLHQLTEPENARQWVDEFLLGRCDLSRVSWVATANATTKIPASLLSRFQVIRVEGPDLSHRSAMLHSVLKEVSSELDSRVELNQIISDAEWQILMQHAKTPRMARRMITELMGISLRQKRLRPH